MPNLKRILNIYRSPIVNRIIGVMGIATFGGLLLYCTVSDIYQWLMT